MNGEVRMDQVPIQIESPPFIGRSSTQEKPQFSSGFKEVTTQEYW